MLNGARLNARRFNIGARPRPMLFSGDAEGELAIESEFIRTRHFGADAPIVASADILLSARRYLNGDLFTTALSELDASAVRVGSGVATVELAGSLYYTRIIYWTGAAALQVVAISDVGVVYGEGSGFLQPLASLNGARARRGFGDAIATTSGDLAASAIRHAATANQAGLGELFARLDSAHITSSGIRYVDGFGDAYAYFDLVDAGMKRQVFIGGADMLIAATGSGSAVRNAVGSGIINGLASINIRSMRRAEGAAVAVVASSLAGEILVPFEADAVIRLQAAMTGYVYRRSGVLSAASSIIAELEAVRRRLGASGALVVGVIECNGARRRVGRGASVVTLNAESTASDFNFIGVDDDDEVFARPAMQREFARPAVIREWRRA